MLDAATVGGTGGSDFLYLVMGEMSSRMEAKADWFLTIFFSCCITVCGCGFCGHTKSSLGSLAKALMLRLAPFLSSVAGVLYIVIYGPVSRHS